jgi:hypothetical protein
MKEINISENIEGSFNETIILDESTYFNKTTNISVSDSNNDDTQSMGRIEKITRILKPITRTSNRQRTPNRLLNSGVYVTTNEPEISLSSQKSSQKKLSPTKNSSRQRQRKAVSPTVESTEPNELDVVSKILEQTQIHDNETEAIHVIPFIPLHQRNLNNEEITNTVELSNDILNTQVQRNAISFIETIQQQNEMQQRNIRNQFPLHDVDIIPSVQDLQRNATNFIQTTQNLNEMQRRDIRNEFLLQTQNSRIVWLS